MKSERSLFVIDELLCDATTCKENVYIDETGIGMEERFGQHQADVIHNQKSAVARHMTNTAHQISSIKLIEYEPRKYKKETERRIIHTSKKLFYECILCMQHSPIKTR